MRQIASLVFVAAALFLAPGAVDAQTDFLKRGTDLLRGLSSGGSGGASSALSEQEIGSGLREALKVGADTVVSNIGAVDGFNADPKIHIPLPDSLTTVQSTLSRIGLSGMMDDLETRLNRAAEEAAPEARQVLWQAIDDMTWDDARGILEGPDDSATRYLESKMSVPLADRMKPIVESSLREVGAVKAYDEAIGQYKTVPFMPDAKANLTDHVLRRALQGLFLYLGEEEAAIRQNPAKRSTELLRKVFGG
ncbi:MAG: DUF4197 domain-containing protein [Alphaproteobacteria bacterium]|nr:DUF4197 domain-containing protein [Alphaproteobacteria bacterium]